MVFLAWPIYQQHSQSWKSLLASRTPYSSSCLSSLVPILLDLLFPNHLRLKYIFPCKITHGAILYYRGAKHFFSSLQVSLASLIIKMIYSIHERKTDKTLTSCISLVYMREIQENWKTPRNGLNQHLKKHLQLKRKDDIGDGKSSMSENAQ